MTSPGNLCISAALACALPASATLWWYARAIDRDGVGRALFTLDDAASDLQVAKPTIYRWLAQCQDKGLLQRIDKGDGVVIVRYLSLVKAAVMAQVDDVGACGFIPMAQVRSIKFLATDMQIEANQRASIYATAAKGSRRETTQTLEDFFIKPIFEDPDHPCLPWSGVKSAAGIKYVGPKTVFVGEHYLFSGASQELAANKLSCTPKTVARRLSDKVRSHAPRGVERGLQPVRRRQIARQDMHVPKAAAQQDLGTVAISQGVEAAEGLRRYFVSSNRVWRSECNLYWVTGLDMHPKRHWRKQLKKAKESGLWERMPLRAGEVFSGAQGHVGQS